MMIMISGIFIPYLEVAWLVVQPDISKLRATPKCGIQKRARLKGAYTTSCLGSADRTKRVVFKWIVDEIVRPKKRNVEMAKFQPFPLHRFKKRQG